MADSIRRRDLDFLAQVAVLLDARAAVAYTAANEFFTAKIEERVNAAVAANRPQVVNFLDMIIEPSTRKWMCASEAWLNVTTDLFQEMKIEGLAVGLDALREAITAAMAQVRLEPEAFLLTAGRVLTTALILAESTT